jgi:hypothetical protein
MQFGTKMILGLCPIFSGRKKAAPQGGLNSLH